MGPELTRSFALVAGALALVTGAAPAAVAQGVEEPPPGLGIRLVDAPVGAADDPRARVYIVDHVRPGDTIERRIEVTNGDDGPLDVTAYPGAARIVDGTFVGDAHGSESELTQWTSVSPGSLTVQGHGRSMVTVTIAVPEDASEGERYGVVWAQVSGAGADGGVTQVSRVGIRIYLSVGPGGPPPADFSIGALTGSRGADGAPRVEALVSNTGGRALDLRAELELTEGPGGLAAGPFAASAVTSLGVGEEAPVAMALDPQLPDGPWTVRLTVTSGTVQQVAESTLTFEENATAQAGAVPWTVMWAAAVVVVLTLLVLIVRSRSRRRRRAREHGAVGAESSLAG